MVGWTQKLGFMTAVLPALAFAGPGDGCDERQIAAQANRLAIAAHAFETQADRLGGCDHLVRASSAVEHDAENLSTAARHGNCLSLRRDFAFVERSFAKLQADVRGHRDVRTHALFRSVDAAYDDLADEFRGGHRPGPRPGPGPRPRPRTALTTIHCASGQMRPTTCHAPGVIVSARVIAQRSAARCDQGRTWNYGGTAITVERGCRADFEVEYSIR